MAVIVLPSRWQRQPTGPVEIDWNHGMAGDLIGAFVGGRDVDLCQPNTPPVYTNAAAAQQEHVATEYGIARVAGNVSGQVYWDISRRGLSPLSAGLTAWGRVAPWSASPSNYVFSVTQDASSQRFGWGYEATTRRFRAYIRTGNGNQYSATSTTVIDQYRWHDAGAAYEPGTLHAWLDGIEVADNNTIAASDTPTTRFALANSSGPSFLVPVVYAWIGYHPEFMPELSRNPWQLLRKRLYKFVSLSSGPVAPTLSLPGVIDIGTTSARPRVTLDFA